ncbi:hypothetical protein ACN4EK_05720 [Pantanalinema rosaneae CENA516]|uniref:hypothetical protein n=1 Tax=Pantanalinema rosaneae TaxID=1620701 RepID=UPI003D6DD765
MDFEPPPIPRRQRPRRPSYAPVTARELLLDGSFKDRPGLLIAEAEPGAIVRSPSGAIVPQPPGAIVLQPRGLAVHQRYPVYVTPGFISSEPGTKTQPASKAQFKLQLRKFPTLKLPNLRKLRLPHWKRPAPTTTTTTSPSQPKSQSVKPSEKLAGFKLPKPALSGAGFGSIGLGRSGKSIGKGGADNFGNDSIAQLLVKLFLVLLILIPLIL